MTNTKREHGFCTRLHRPYSIASHSAWLFPLVVSATLPSNAARGTDDKLPDGADVLDAYVEATGGKEAYAKITNRVQEGTLEIPSMNLTCAMTVYSASPAKLYSELKSEALGVMTQGTDGKVAWENSVMTGPRIREGKEKIAFIQDAQFNSVHDWRHVYKNVECVGVETIGKAECYKLVLTPNEGDPVTHYYDKQTHLLVKVEKSILTPQGPVVMEMYPEDYKEIDGIRFSHKARLVAAGVERVLTLTRVRHNVDLPPDRFEMPEEVRAIAGK